MSTPRRIELADQDARIELNPRETIKELAILAASGVGRDPEKCIA